MNSVIDFRARETRKYSPRASRWTSNEKSSINCRRIGLRRGTISANLTRAPIFAKARTRASISKLRSKGHRPLYGTCKDNRLHGYESFRPGKIRHGVVGDSNPTSVHLRKRWLHRRSIRALRHWPLKPGRKAVCGVLLRLRVDRTVDCATRLAT